ncbi:ABC transporter substrate-binding protein [Haloferax sp. YSSS75]|uniref:ABC transporter substrate-binding protein n=1 Tax=Haloferax sp. YSSS75 TaxID=3388564 RepID=UPI00398CC0C6
MEELASSYEPTKVNAKKVPVDEINQKLTTALQSQSNLPSASLIRGALLKSLARNGGVIRTTDLVEKYSDRIFDVAKTKNKIDGKWFSVPNDLGPYCVMYNADLFDEVGLPTDPAEVEQEIQTWDQFIEAGKDYEKKTGNKFVALSTFRDAHGLGAAMQTQNGGRWYNADGEFQYDQQANIEAGEKVKRIYKEINKPLQMFSSQYWEAYRSEEIAALPAPGWLIGFMIQSLSDMEGKWRVMLMPSLNGDTPRGSNFGGAGAGIPVALDSDESDAVMDFLQHWHLSEEAFNVKLRNGVFPAHYVEGAEQAEAEDPFFGGQKRNMKLVESAQNSPAQYQRPTIRAWELDQEAHRKFLEEDADVEQTLKDTHAKILEELPEKDKTAT